jgi:hypothetical protein
MSNSLTITINDEKISITAEDGSLLARASCLVTLDETGQIISVGKSPEDLQNKLRIRLFNPFLITNFHPKFAAITISQLVDEAIVLVSEPMREGSVKPIEWHIKIPGYERLDKKVQESFEYYAQQLSRAKVKRLSINNQQKSIEVFRRAVQAIKIGLVLSVLALQWLVFRMLQITRSEEMAKPLTWVGFLITFAGYMGVLYLAALIYFAVCKLALRNLVPTPVYKDWIEETDISPVKLWSLLQDRLNARQKGG